MAESDKPREKMIKGGPQVLSSQELLAVVLNSGTRKEDVLSMANRILKDYGEKAIINKTNPKDLEKELEIPFVKACQIVACFELGKRFFSQQNGRARYVRSAKQAYEFLSPIKNLKKECVYGLYLNSRYQIIHEEIISVGSATSNVVYPKEVFRPAIEYSAAAVILAHNHPSGDPKPTKEDIVTTKLLQEAGHVLGIDLLDHVIVADNKYLSILEAKDENKTV
jgi:DNA repair protein RadC